MSHAKAGIVVASLFLFGVEARAGEDQRKIEPGIYSNVHVHEASGDVGGIELEIMNGDGQIVETTICDGWCDKLDRTTYTVRGNSIEYVYDDGHYIDEPNVWLNVRVTRSGKGVVVETESNGYSTKDRLKRRKFRLGLDVAASSMEDRQKLADHSDR